MKRGWGIVFLFLVVIFAACTREVKKPYKILFLGHSLLYTNDLPKVFADLAHSKGKEVIIQKSLKPDYKIKDHINDPESLEKIKQDEWDYIIISENNYVLTTQNRFDIDLYPNIQKLFEIIDPNKTLFMINMGFKTGGRFGEYIKMQDSLNTISKEIEKRYGPNIYPVGVAWEDLYKLRPEIELWQFDSVHPTTAGTYLMACLLFNTIYDQSAEHAWFIPEKLSKEDARIIQKQTYETWKKIKKENR